MKMNSHTINTIENIHGLQQIQFAQGLDYYKQNPEVCLAGTTGYYGAKITHYYIIQVTFSSFFR
jgi:hypothetical protein